MLTDLVSLSDLLTSRLTAWLSGGVVDFADWLVDALADWFLVDWLVG
jgi:hypothetical protein